MRVVATLPEHMYIQDFADRFLCFFFVIQQQESSRPSPLNIRFLLLLSHERGGESWWIFHIIFVFVRAKVGFRLNSGEAKKWEEDTTNCVTFLWLY